MRVVLYTRPGCHLCDEARVMLERIRGSVPFAFSERDIESDDALMRCYLERIPVIEIDGEEAFELQIDETELHHHLARVQS
jgi:glutaredoxin